MRRWMGYLIAVAVVVGATGLAVLLVSLAPEPETREPPSQIPYADTALVVAADRPIPVRGAGTVRPSAEVEIAPQVSGRVVWVDPGFVSGRTVESGQPLFRLEEADYEHRVLETEAAVAARQVTLLEAHEEATIAHQTYQLFKQRRPADAARTANPLTLRVPQLKAAKAALEREKALLARAKLALSRTQVVAPFDGIVRHESVAVGQLLAAGQSVGSVFSSDAVEVVVSLSDADATLIPRLWETGSGAAPVTAQVFAEYADVAYAWQGFVAGADASLDAQTRTIDVIVRVPTPFAVPQTNSDPGRLTIPPLLVGKFVDVTIDGLAPDRYFKTSRTALQAGNEVWTVRDDGTVGIVPVHVLQRTDDEIYVTGALEDGRRVVVGGIRFATEGMAIRTDEAEGLRG